MKRIDYSKVPRGTGMSAPKPGGYVCTILAAIDTPRKEYLIIEYDISEGDYKGYFTKLEGKVGFWHSAARSIRSYKERALLYFVIFKEAVEASNEGFIFVDDERTFLDKKVGVIFGLEEYAAKTGEIKERLYAVEFVSVDKIRNGDFTIPDVKKYKPKEPPVSGNNPYDNPPKPEVCDDDLPF